jgi:pimeloyl-ACP methyl ester carboxylesterase
MAKDAIAFSRALGLNQVDLLGFSMGGFVAQVIVEERPDLVRRIILAGTGPGGGEGIDKVTLLTSITSLRESPARRSRSPGWIGEAGRSTRTSTARVGQVL